MRQFVIHSAFHAYVYLLMMPVAFSLPGPFPMDVQPLTTIHVATNGNNTTGNGSFAQPYRTVQRAGQDALPGVEILIHPGVYSGGEFINNLTGAATNPIWIRGISATNRPLFSGGSEGFHFTKARYVMIQNIEVAHATANGINCDDGGEYANADASGFLVFSNVFIRDIGSGGNQDGLKLSGIRDFYVYNTEITRCGGAASGSAIDMVGCHRGLIQSGSFYDLSANAIQAKGGSSDIEIRQCIISNAGHRGVNAGGSTDFEFFRPPLATNQLNYEASNIRLYSSIIMGCTASVAFVNCVDGVAANNTIIEPTRWVFRILQETTTASGYVFAPCRSNTFQNNIVYYNDAVLNQYVNIGANTEPGTFFVRNNLWYPYDNPGASPYALPGLVTNNRYGQDPLFIQPSQQNYRITLLSPASTNGFSQVNPAEDKDGVLYLNPRSVGAFEISGDTDNDALPDYWEMSYFTSLVYQADADPDGDEFNNGDEYAADTDPSNSDSYLAILQFYAMADDGFVLEWKGGRQAGQFVEYAMDGHEPWQVLLTNMPPTAVSNRFEWMNSEENARIRIRATR